MINRRKFLQASCLGAASGFAANLASFNAFAADTSDYKALVCVFLRGGMDSHDMIIPFDEASSNKYEAIRTPIIDGYASNGFESRRRGNLLSLGNANVSGAIADGREFAMPKDMAGLHQLYQQGKLAVVGNVGPLIEPTTRASFLNGNATIPARLFSHNDQESTWLASSAEGATEGWGGRYGDIMVAANANQINSFTTVTTGSAGVFVNGLNVTGFNLSSNGGEIVRSLNSSFQGSRAFGEAYANALFGLNADNAHLFNRDVGLIRGTAIDDNILIGQAFARTADPTADFEPTSFGNQLKAVAKMIASRDEFGMRRQIFIVSERGFDTHSNQTTDMPLLQQQISQAMSAFYQETVNLGIADKVTTFTGSDFGRSLVPNSSGTDHGWGGHHLILGGAVNGGQIVGNIPEAELEHNQDAGRGSLIPELAVDQYAAVLGRWFGLTRAETRELFPNLNSNLDDSALNSLFNL